MTQSTSSFTSSSHYRMKYYGREVDIREHPTKTKRVGTQSFPYYICKWKKGGKEFETLIEPKTKAFYAGHWIDAQ